MVNTPTLPPTPTPTWHFPPGAGFPLSWGLASIDPGFVYQASPCARALPPSLHVCGT